MARILMLEDNAELAFALSMALELEGHEVTVTPSGSEAVLAVAREAFDLVLADLQVDDLSGLGVWQVVNDLASIPVIAMSASEGPWMKDAWAAGVSACLPKPFEIEVLTSLIETMLAHGRDSAWPDDVVDLDEPDLQRLRALDDASLDALPFGLIRLDEQGIVVGYNAFESTASGYPPDRVLGRRFSEVAPCTAVQRFTEAVDDAIQRPAEPHALRFVFPHRTASTLVTVRLFFDAARRQLWLFVSRRSMRREQPPAASA